jgi:hypothetical protein
MSTSFRLIVVSCLWIMSISFSFCIPVSGLCPHIIFFGTSSPCQTCLLSDWSLSSDVVRQREENGELAPYLFYFRPAAFFTLVFLGGLALIGFPLTNAKTRKGWLPSIATVVTGLSSCVSILSISFNP